MIRSEQLPADVRDEILRRLVAGDSVHRVALVTGRHVLDVEAVAAGAGIPTRQGRGQGGTPATGCQPPLRTAQLPAFGSLGAEIDLESEVIGRGHPEGA